MLASHIGRRLTCTPWISIRYYNERSRRPRPPGDWGLNNPDEGRRKLLSQPVETGRHDERRGKASRPLGEHTTQSKEGRAKPSLMEQLFPEEAKRQADAHPPELRELPLLPLQGLPAPPVHRTYSTYEDGPTYRTPEAKKQYAERQRDMAVQGPQPTVLVLRNASTSLTEDDFRRAAPQGEHLEGWSLEQSNFLKVVPGRNLATLEQQNFYYLIFRHQIAAYHYQTNATVLSVLSSKHTPSSVTSPPAPPPGYLLADGRDLHAALQSYSLTPPSQRMTLRLLRFPLSPLVDSIVRNQGYSRLVHRPEKLPFEVRLTLDGPQLSRGTIEFILHETALARSLGWSGGPQRMPKITKWEPVFAPSATGRGRIAKVWGKKDQRMMTEDQQIESEVGEQQAAQTAADGVDTGSDGEQLKRRVPRSVYIVGFHTETAALSFVRHWHRRPMFWQGEEASAGIEEEGDLPAITNAELLW